MNKAVLYHYSRDRRSRLRFTAQRERAARGAAFAGFFLGQREPVCAGTDPAVAGVAWCCYSSWGAVFPSWLGVADYRAKVIE